jgi:hypothetical protein
VGSSPIGHPSKTRVNTAKQVFLKNKLAPSAPALFKGSVELTPGGEKQLEQLEHLISTNTTGKRWYVSYYINTPSGRTRKRSYGRVDSIKDPVEKMEALLALRGVYKMR